MVKSGQRIDVYGGLGGGEETDAALETSNTDMMRQLADLAKETKVKDTTTEAKKGNLNAVAKNE